MDLGTVAAAVLRTGASTGLRDERLAVSLRLVGSLLDGRVRIVDLSPDLAREVRAAAADGQATLILPAGPGPARIDLGGRQFVIPAALRDALIAALRGGAPIETRAVAQAPAAPARAALDAVRVTTQALALAAPAADAKVAAALGNAMAATGVVRAARNESSRANAQSVAFETPLFDPRNPTAAADRIAARVAGSGVFFESHVAQWARGDRSDAAVLQEAQQLSKNTLSDPARAEARTAVQLEALQRHSIALTGPAWTGQQMLLELGRDPQVLPDGAEGASGEGEQVFVARLRLDLPRLGPIEVRLRLAGDAVAVTVQSAGASEAAERLAAALPEFAAALAARGLRPVLLQALPAEDAMR
jgi:hypothetical protein